MAKHASRADLARELIEAIDDLVGYVKAHHGHLLDYFGEVKEHLHPLGRRVQVLATALDLASREKPVYNAYEEIEAFSMPSGQTIRLMRNPTWPGWAERHGDGPWLFRFMPVDGHPWYEEMDALRLKAKRILAGEAPEMEIETPPGSPGVASPDAAPGRNPNDYVSASMAQEAMGFPTYKEFHKWLDEHRAEVRTYKPSKYRLMVHMGDTLACKAKKDKRESDAADRPAEEIADEYARLIEARKAKERDRKASKRTSREV